MAKKPTKVPTKKPEPKRTPAAKPTKVPTKKLSDALDLGAEGEFVVQPFEMKRVIPPLAAPVFAEKAILDEAAALVGTPADWVTAVPPFELKGNPTITVSTDLLDWVFEPEAAEPASQNGAPPEPAPGPELPVVTGVAVLEPAEPVADGGYVVHTQLAEPDEALPEPVYVEVHRWFRSDTESVRPPFGRVSMVRGDLWVARVMDREIGTFPSRERAEREVEKRRPW